MHLLRNAFEAIEVSPRKAEAASKAPPEEPGEDVGIFEGSALKQEAGEDEWGGTRRSIKKEHCKHKAPKCMKGECKHVGSQQEQRNERLSCHHADSVSCESLFSCVAVLLPRALR